MSLERTDLIIKIEPHFDEDEDQDENDNLTPINDQHENEDDNPLVVFNSEPENNDQITHENERIKESIASTVPLGLEPTTPKKLPFTQATYGQCADLILDDAIKVLEVVGTVVPENTYWAGSFYSIVIPFILSEIKTALALPQPALFGPIWNYIDSLFTFFLSIAMIAQASEDARRDAQFWKGILNFLGGVQLVTLTTLGFFMGAATALSGFGFAAAGAMGFIISLDEWYRASRRLDDIEYWMSDSKAQLSKWQEQRIKLKEELVQLKSLHVNIPDSDTRKKEWSDWAIKRKKIRLDELDNQVTELEEDIKVREKVISHQKLTPDERRRERRIQEDCEKQFEAKNRESALLFLAFIGMLFMCFPFTQVAGIILVGSVSGLLFCKNASKLASGVKSVFRFFSPPIEEKQAPKAQERSPVLDAAGMCMA